MGEGHFGPSGFLGTDSACNGVEVRPARRPQERGARWGCKGTSDREDGCHAIGGDFDTDVDGDGPGSFVYGS